MHYKLCLNFYFSLKLFLKKVPQKETILNKFEQEYNLTLLSINYKKIKGSINIQFKLAISCTTHRKQSKNPPSIYKFSNIVDIQNNKNPKLRISVAQTTHYNKQAF